MNEISPVGTGRHMECSILTVNKPSSAAAASPGFDVLPQKLIPGQPKKTIALSLMSF